MTHPLERIPGGKRFPAFIWFLVTAFWLSVALQFTGPASPSIVDFEFCRTVDKANAIINAWSQAARVQAGFNLGLDYLYIPFYSTTLAMACIWAAGARRASRIWHNVCMLFAWGLWLAAAFDAVENYLLFTMLKGTVVNPYPAIATLCASCKFSLILLGLVFCAVAVIIRIISAARPAAKAGTH